MCPGEELLNGILNGDTQTFSPQRRNMADNKRQRRGNNNSQKPGKCPKGDALQVNLGALGQGSAKKKFNKKFVDSELELNRRCKVDADNEALGLILVPDEEGEADVQLKYGQLSAHNCVKTFKMRVGKKGSEPIEFLEGTQLLDQIAAPDAKEGVKKGRVDWLIGKLTTNGLFSQHFGPGVMPPVLVDYEGRNHGFATYVNTPRKPKIPVPDFPPLASLKASITQEAMKWFDQVGMVDGTFMEDVDKLYPGPREFFETGRWTVGEVREDVELIWHVNFTRLAMCLLGMLVIFSFYQHSSTFVIYGLGESYICVDEHKCDELYFENLERFSFDFKLQIDEGCVARHDATYERINSTLDEHYTKIRQEVQIQVKYCLLITPKYRWSACYDLYDAVEDARTLDLVKLGRLYSESLEECTVLSDGQEFRMSEVKRSNFEWIVVLEVLLLFCSYFFCYVLTDAEDMLLDTKASFGDRTKARNVTITVLKYIHATKGVRHTSHSSGDVKSKQILAKVRVESHVDYSLWNWSSFHPVYTLLLSLPLPYSTRRFLMGRLRKSRPHAKLDLDTHVFLVDLGLVCQLLDQRVLVPNMDRSAQRLRIQCKAASMTTHQIFSGDVLGEKDLFTNSVFLAEQLARKCPGSAPLDF